MSDTNAPAPNSPETEQLIALTEKFFASGGTFKDMKGLDDKTMKAVYAVAYRLYENGKYEDALKSFQFLGFMDHYEPKYFMGLAACQQMLKQYDKAVESYGYAGILTGLNDPSPALHAAECHLAMGNLEDAASGFRYAHGIAVEKPELEPLATRAKSLLDVVEQQLQQSS